MSLMLKKLISKGDVDEAIKTVEDRVLVIRFGKDDEIGCMQTDNVLLKSEVLLSRMAEIFIVNIEDVPVYREYFEISHIPSTVFFFNGQHIKVDSGTSDHTKFVGPFPSKQDFIDLVEVVYRGAMRGKFLVHSPIEPSRVSKFDLVYRDI